MANAPRDTERLQIRVEKRILEPLKSDFKAQKLANLQALVLKILEDYVVGQKKCASAVTPARESDIDLRSLLIEAHKSNAEANRAIAEQARTIAAMAQEQKNAPIAEPVIVAGPPSPSTQRQQILKLLGEMEASEAQLMISDLKITVPAMRSRSRSATL